MTRLHVIAVKNLVFHHQQLFIFSTASVNHNWFTNDPLTKLKYEKLSLMFFVELDKS